LVVLKAISTKIYKAIPRMPRFHNMF